MDRVFGHGGAGGSEALVDRDNELVVAYTTNIPRGCMELRDKLYEVVGMRWRYWNDNVSIQDLQMTTASGGQRHEQKAIHRRCRGNGCGWLRQCQSGGEFSRGLCGS